MSERFLYFFDTLKINLGSAGVFLCCMAIVVVSFFVVMFLSIFKRDYALRKRTWFFLVCLSTLSFQFALALFSFDSVGYGLLSCAVYLLFFIPILSIRCKKQQADAREFIKFIDQRIKKDCLEQNCEDTSSINTNFNLDFTQPNCEKNDESEQRFIEQDSLTQTKKIKKEKSKDIDFTHVKNVIARLDFYALSTSEKKTVSDLERAIAFAEREGADEQTRIKINDGLGALLKIMSKHGI